MYNHYQNHHDYVVIEPEQTSPIPEPPKTNPHKPSAPLGEASGTITQFLKGIFKNFSLEHFDTGDILLVLIILFLFLEGDNLELIITLGLMLLLGLGEENSDSSHQEA